MDKWITRIAPSPTGDMHLGTARTALFNWLAARATGGKFILRIDDTDSDRTIPYTVGVIKDTLLWLGLDWDDEIFQHNRLSRYRDIADWLVATDLAKVADNGAVLLNVVPGAMSDKTWYDTIGGVQTYTPNIIKGLDRDLVMIKGDGWPTYHFASVVDDMDMGVNWIIRGNDHFSNTFLHVMIYHALGADIPRFSHVGLITKDKKKMSKRDGAASMLSYRSDGYDPDAMNDYMMRLCWGPKDGIDRKIITRDMALDMFLDGNLKAASSGFDKIKLDSLNRRHIGRKVNA